MTLPFRVLSVSQAQGLSSAEELQDQLSIRISSTDPTHPFSGTVTVPQEGDFVAAVSQAVSKLLGGVEAIFDLG